MIRGVAFDFDGTLVDSNDIKRGAFYEVSAGHADARSHLDDILARDGGATRYEVFAALAGRLVPGNASAAQSLAATLVREYEAVTRQRVVDCPEIAGAGAALAALRGRDVRLYMVSATPQAPLVEIVEARGMAGWFERVLGVPPGKADHLRAIARDDGIAPRDLVYVGDREVDRRAALAAGCRFVGVTTDTAEFSAPPEAVLRDLADLPAVIERLGGAH